MAQNEILLRVENRQDKFDSNSQTVFVDLNQICKDLFAEANGRQPSSLTFEEMNLSGVLKKQDLSFHKWMGVDGDGSQLNLALS